MPIKYGITSERIKDRNSFIFPVKRTYPGLKFIYTFFWHIDADICPSKETIIVNLYVKPTIINLN